MPDLMDAVRLASILFIAGIGTTAGLLATAFQLLGERPDLQQLLRDEPEWIANFLEETMRIDSPIKGTFRLARVTKTVGGVEIPAGSTVMLVIGAANRDPRKFECPDGSKGARTYKYVPGYLARSLQRLHLEFTPASR